jgi:hypothetical protein
MPRGSSKNKLNTLHQTEPVASGGGTTIAADEGKRSIPVSEAGHLAADGSSLSSLRFL